ncbi:MAG: hypothetical protein ACI4IM_00460 [Acutalibacteraceae bacterium]
MTDRERMIELLNNKQYQGNATETGENYVQNSEIADYLLEHGVIVPPCKVGDTVYIINRANKAQEMIFDLIDLRCTCVNDTNCMCGSLCNDIGHNVCQYRFKNDFSDIGKTVFLTREEAEQAAKERESNA